MNIQIRSLLLTISLFSTALTWSPNAACVAPRQPETYSSWFHKAIEDGVFKGIVRLAMDTTRAAGYAAFDATKQCYYWLRQPWRFTQPVSESSLNAPKPSTTEPIEGTDTDMTALCAIIQSLKHDQALLIHRRSGGIEVMEMDSRFVDRLINFASQR